MNGPWVAAVVLAGGAPFQEPPLACDEVRALEIRAEDPILTGFGPSHALECTTSFSGTLYVWASSAELDPILRIETPAGGRLAEEDGDGVRAPCVLLDVKPGRALRIIVAAADPEAHGALELHLVSAPETEATRAAARAAQEACAGVARLRRSGELEQARALLEEALEALGATPGAELSAVSGQAGWSLGEQAFGLGALQPAEDAWRLARDHLERCTPDDHPQLQIARNWLSVVLATRGELPAARALQQQVLDVYARSLPEDDPDLLKVRTNLALTLQTMGELSAARALQEQVLEVQTRKLADDAPDLQLARQNLSITLHESGEPAAARALAEKVLEVRTATLPADHQELQAARINLAAILFALGDIHAARELQQQVVEVFSRILPEEHPHLQVARGNLATTLSTLGDLDKARELQEQVLEVLSRTTLEESPDLQWARITLAVTLRDLGDFQPARELMEQALAVLARTLPPEHLDLQTTSLCLANILRPLGELRAARELEERALASFTRTLPDDHPYQQTARMNLALTLARLGDAAACAEQVSELVASLRSSVRSLVVSASPREVEERISARALEVSTVISLARGAGLLEPSPELEREAFAMVESLRGAGLLCSRLLRVAGLDAEVAALREEARAASTELSRLTQGAADAGALTDLRRRRDDAQRDLVARLASTPQGRELLVEPDLAGLSATLEEGEALVATWRCKLYRFVKGDSREEDAPESLVAFVVQNGGGLCLVDLGPVAPIEEAVEAWRGSLGFAGDARGISAVSSGTTSERTSAESVRRLVFDPLRPYLAGVEHLTLASDDVLHLVPFEALPLEDGVVGDRFWVERRSTLWELLLDEQRLGDGALVVVGGVDYGVLPAASATGAGVAASLPRSAPWSAGFAPLPATLIEAEGIAGLWPGEASDRPVVLSGAECSKARLTACAPLARYLHVATHGWYAPESVRSTADLEPIDPGSAHALTMSLEEQVLGSSPLVLSGLALSGSNGSVDALGRVPGLLTAEELATFDLSRCELAVLSACDTSVGVRRAGQGVASLQKALHMAGARSAITSLWPVPDEATKELMVDLYRRLWIEKKPVHQALWEAQTRLRELRDEHGDPVYTTRDWAAWVLTGDPE